MVAKLRKLENPIKLKLTNSSPFPFIFINSLSKETCLLVLLNVFLFAFSLIKASKVVSGGTKHAKTMFCEKHKHVFLTRTLRNPFEFYVLIG